MQYLKVMLSYRVQSAVDVLQSFGPSIGDRCAQTGTATYASMGTRGEDITSAAC